LEPEPSQPASGSTKMMRLLAAPALQYWYGVLKRSNMYKFLVLANNADYRPPTMKRDICLHFEIKFFVNLVSCVYFQMETWVFYLFLGSSIRNLPYKCRRYTTAQKYNFHILCAQNTEQIF
jgi:hypothetical protein